MSCVEQRQFRPEGEAPPPPPDLMSASEPGAKASDAAAETPEAEATRLAAEAKQQQTKLAWELKQARELLQDVGRDRQEAAVTLEELESETLASRRLPALPEVPEKLGHLSSAEKAQAQKRREQAAKNADSWHRAARGVESGADAVSFVRRFGPLFTGEGDLDRVVARENPAYFELGLTRDDAKRAAQGLIRGHRQYRRVTDPETFEEARQKADAAERGLKAEFDRMLGNGDALSWYLWKREFLARQLAELLQPILQNQHEAENLAAGRPEDLDRRLAALVAEHPDSAAALEAQLKKRGIDTEALFKDRTADPVERDEAVRYRLPLGQALNPRARRLAGEFVKAEEAKNRRLDRAAALHDQLSNREALFGATKAEHEKLIAEAVADAKRGDGRRIEFQSPELREKYDSVVEELVALEKTVTGREAVREQARYKLRALIVAQLPNVPGLRQQALADAAEKSKPEPGEPPAAEPRRRLFVGGRRRPKK